MDTLSKEHLAECLKPIFKEAGYRKMRTSWRKEKDGLVLVLNIQGSQWEKKDYYINVGVYILALEPMQNPPESSCHIRSRIEEREKSCSEICEEILSWFEKHDSLEKLKMLYDQDRLPLITSIDAKNFLSRIDWRWPDVDQLEAQERYGQACHLMFSEWKQEPRNLKVFLRLSFLCWYVITDYEVLTNTDVKREEIIEFEVLMKELLDFGMEEFYNDPDYLWIFGYMIYMFPENFNGKLEREAGKRMIEEAVNRRPEDPIIKLVHSGSCINPEENQSFKQLRETVKLLLPERFMGEGELQRYFREVLDRVNNSY